MCICMYVGICSDVSMGMDRGVYFLVGAAEGSSGYGGDVKLAP